MRGGGGKFDDASYVDFISNKKRNVPFRFRQITGDGNGGLNEDDLDFLGPSLDYYREKNENEKKNEQKKLKNAETKKNANDIEKYKNQIKNTHTGKVFTLEDSQDFQIGFYICLGVAGEEWPKPNIDNFTKGAVILKEQKNNKWGWARPNEDITNPRTVQLCEDETKTEKFTFFPNIDFIVSGMPKVDEVIPIDNKWAVKADIFFKTYRLDNLPSLIQDKRTEITQKSIEHCITLLEKREKEKNGKSMEGGKVNNYFEKKFNQSSDFGKIIEKYKKELEIINEKSLVSSTKHALKKINKELYIYTPEPNEDEALDTIFGDGDDEALNAALIQRLKAQGIYNHQSE